MLSALIPGGDSRARVVWLSSLHLEHKVDVTSFSECAGRSSCSQGQHLSDRAPWVELHVVGGASRGTSVVGFLPTGPFKGNFERTEATAGMVVPCATATRGVIPARPKWLQSLLKIRVGFFFSVAGAKIMRTS